jgi:ligand-binding sensor domain-containing protein
MRLACIEPNLAESLASRDFTIRHWTVDNGLPQNRVSAFAQTPDGYLWLGTWFGLVRFDGLRFTIFNRYNTPALINDVITALVTAPDGALWIGTHDGLVRLKDQEWTHFTNTNGLPDRAVLDLAFDGAGQLWADSGSKVGQFPGGPFIPAPSWPTDVPGKKLIPLGNRSMAVSGPRGPVPVQGPRQPVFPWPPEMPVDDYAQAATSDGEDGWWLGTFTGLWHWDSSHKWTRVWANHSTRLRVDLLFLDQTGTLWAGVRNAGLHRFNGSTLEPVKLDNSESPPAVASIFEDREGNIWIGTEGGLFQLRRRFLKVFGRADGLKSDEVWTVAQGNSGEMWLACGGISRIGKGEWPPGIPRQLEVGGICALMEKNGTLWMNYPAGLVGVKPGVEPAVIDLGGAAQSLYQDHEDRVWAGNSRGAHPVRAGKLLRLPGLPLADIRFFLQTRNGTMWFGSKNNGLYSWRDGVARQFKKADGLADDFVICIYEDEARVMWIGTENGLSRLAPATASGGISAAGAREPKFFTFTTKHGLLDNLINHILEDDAGFLWFSCNRGIFRMSRAELNAVASGQKSEAACAVFGTADGMFSSETNGEHQPAGCKSRDGQLWFPTAMGVVAIDPKRLSTNEVPPAVVIEQVTMDSEVVYGDEATPRSRDAAGGPVTKVGPGRGRVLKIRYTANSFAAPEKIRSKRNLKDMTKIGARLVQVNALHFIRIFARVITGFV